MPLLARMVPSPLHVEVRQQAVQGLRSLLADRRIANDGHIAVVVGPGVGDAVLSELGPDVASHVFRVDEDTVDAAMALASELKSCTVDVVVAIGGGRTIDVTKYAATRLGLPMVAVATSLAHDGLASPVSVLRHQGHRNSYGVAVPIAVVVDLDLVGQSPDRQIAAGVGDLLSNLSALADWRLANERFGEPIDGLAYTLAMTSAEAVLHRRDDPRSLPFLNCLAQSLVLSGMAMAVAGTSRPSSGGCHEISHAIDELFPGCATHGEQVAVGTLFTFFLRGDDDTFGSLGRAFRHHGLPMDHRALGLTDGQFVEAVVRAPATRPGRYTILEHLELDEPAIHDSVAGFLDAIGELDGS